MRKQKVAMRLLCAVIWLLCVVGCLNGKSTKVLAEELVTEDGYVYKILDNGTAEDTADDTIEITDYKGEAEALIIPNEIDGKSVTHIGNSAFYSYHDATSIQIPSSIVSIGSTSFGNMLSLERIEIDSANMVYEGNATYDVIVEIATKKLVKACNTTIIPDDIKCIGEQAFARCFEIEHITIPDSVTSIESLAFWDCSALESIVIPQNVTMMSNDILVSCENLNEISVHSDNPVYNSNGNCNAIIKTETKELIIGCKSTKIPQDVVIIGMEAFDGCKGLSTIEIPESVTKIKDYAFSHSGLTEIVIPSSVVDIDSSAFSGCSSLTSVQVDSDNPVYNSKDNCNAIIEIATNKLVLGCKTTIIPEDITSIASFAFYSIQGFETIKIPNSVTSIGHYAFADCYDITSMELPDGVTSIDGAFYTCTHLESIVIPKGVTTIEDYTFTNCRKLKKITILDNVTNIEEGAFDECPSDMTVVTYKDSYADKWALENGYNVEYLTKPSTPNPTPEPSPNPSPAPNPGPMPEKDPIPTPAAVGEVLSDTVNSCTVKVTSSDVANPTVEYTGTTNSKAKKITIPEKVEVDGITYIVTSIGKNAFKNNKKITHVTIGIEVTEINASAFENCKALKTVTIKSKNLTKIGKKAFKGCKKLKTITIKSSKLTKNAIGKNALKGTNTKLTIKVPKKMVKKYKKYFNNKGNKTVSIKKA